MSEAWYIDGYNVVHDLAAPPSKKRPANSRKIVLSELFSKLAGFAASAERRLLVVLDGVGDNNEFRAYRTQSLDIVYSERVSADAYIERALFGARGRARLFVVTRDRALAQVALNGGAQVVTPKDLMERVAKDRQEKRDILHSHDVKAHGFHRPFEEKLKETPPS